MNETNKPIQPIHFDPRPESYAMYQSNCVEFWMPVNPLYMPELEPNRYWVSSCGRICDTKMYYGKGKILPGSYSSKKYIKVDFMTKDGKHMTRKVHRLIMMSFYYFDGCERYEVNHKDGNHENNNLYNLEWVTGSENRLHSIRTELEPTVFSKPVAILTNEQVWMIRKCLLQRKYTYNQIIDILGLRDIPGINRKTIARIALDNSSLYRDIPYVSI